MVFEVLSPFLVVVVVVVGYVGGGAGLAVVVFLVVITEVERVVPFVVLVDFVGFAVVVFAVVRSLVAVVLSKDGFRLCHVGITGSVLSVGV